MAVLASGKCVGQGKPVRPSSSIITMAAVVSNSPFLRDLIARLETGGVPANDSFSGAKDVIFFTGPVFSTSTVTRAKIYNIIVILEGGHRYQVPHGAHMHNTDLDCWHGGMAR